MKTPDDAELQAVRERIRHAFLSPAFLAELDAKIKQDVGQSFSAAIGKYALAVAEAAKAVKSSKV